MSCRMLAEFQSRKAHCVQVKEKDILRILLFISISMIGYLLGWTFVNIDYSNGLVSLDKHLLGDGQTLKHKRFFRTCRPRSWDYLVHMGREFDVNILSLGGFVSFSGICVSLCGYSIYLQYTYSTM